MRTDMPVRWEGRQRHTGTPCRFHKFQVTTFTSIARVVLFDCSC
jgi:hypothetical protein